jgi:hypothetical protein
MSKSFVLASSCRQMSRDAQLSRAHRFHQGLVIALGLMRVGVRVLAQGFIDHAFLSHIAADACGIARPRVSAGQLPAAYFDVLEQLVLV